MHFIEIDILNCYFSAPNNYTLTPMMGKTNTSGHKQAPIFSMKGRSKIGSFHEDLAKVCIEDFKDWYFESVKSIHHSVGQTFIHLW